MRLAIISYKTCWPKKNSTTGYATDGGFPYQIQWISELFDQTELLIPLSKKPLPEGVRDLRGKNLSVKVLKEPDGSDLPRKIRLIHWIFLALKKHSINYVIESIRI